MKINQTENTGSKKQLFVGYAQCKLVGINPTKDELVKLLEVEEEHYDKFKEPEYIGEDAEGNQFVKLTFYVKNLKTNKIDPVYFQITKKEAVSQSGKTQFVNQLGETQWVDDEDNLWDNFTSFQQVLSWSYTNGESGEKYQPGAKPKDIKKIDDKLYRKALKGEVDVYNFIKAIFTLDVRNTETNILLDTKKLFNGNFKDLKSDVLGNLRDNSSVICCYSVKVKDDGTEVQKVSNKFFINGTQMPLLRNAKLDGDKLQTLRMKKDAKQKLTPVEAFFVETTDEANGIKDFFVPVEVKEYDPSENFLTSNAVITAEDSDY